MRRSSSPMAIRSKTLSDECSRVDQTKPTNFWECQISVLIYLTMSTTVVAIYEHGIFKPVSDLPATLKENDRVRITLVTDEENSLAAEFAKWDAASDEDGQVIERRLEEICK